MTLSEAVALRFFTGRPALGFCAGCHALRYVYGPPRLCASCLALPLRLAAQVARDLAAPAPVER